MKREVCLLQPPRGRVNFGVNSRGQSGVPARLHFQRFKDGCQMKEGVRTPDERDGEMSSRPTSNRKLSRTLKAVQCAPFCSLGLRICIRDFITPLKCKIKNQKNQIYYSLLLFLPFSTDVAGRWFGSQDQQEVGVGEVATACLHIEHHHNGPLSKATKGLTPPA